MSGESSPFEMTVSVPNHETGQKILQYLTGSVDDVTFTVDSLGESGPRPCTLSVDEVTAKQMEAARLAVRKGYYQKPKEADLGDVADELGVSKSAVSQRLRALERKMMIELIDSCVQENRNRPVSPRGDD